MNRSNFYQKVTVGGVPQLDFLHNSLSRFDMIYSPRYYRVMGDDGMRPDMISKKVYDTPSLWWVLMLVNDISNPLVDIDPGTVLIVPNRIDVYNFQKKYRLRRS